MRSIHALSSIPLTVRNMYGVCLRNLQGFHYVHHAGTVIVAPDSGVQLGTTGSLKVEADILFVLAYQCQPTETAAGQEMWESKEYLFACEGFGTRLLAFPIGAMLYGIPDAK